MGTPCGDLIVWNTHLGVRGFERQSQGAALLERAQEVLSEDDAPLVLVGDLNARPAAAFVRALAPLLTDARVSTGARVPTYPAWWPILSLDHVLVSAPLRVVELRTDRSRLATIASDHLPLAATLEWCLDTDLRIQDNDDDRLAGAGGRPADAGLGAPDSMDYGAK